MQKQPISPRLIILIVLISTASLCWLVVSLYQLTAVNIAYRQSLELKSELLLMRRWEKDYLQRDTEKALKNWEMTLLGAERKVTKISDLYRGIEGAPQHLNLLATHISEYQRWFKILIASRTPHENELHKNANEIMALNHQLEAQSPEVDKQSIKALESTLIRYLITPSHGSLIGIETQLNRITDLTELTPEQTMTAKQIREALPKFEKSISLAKRSHLYGDHLNMRVEAHGAEDALDELLKRVIIEEELRHKTVLYAASLVILSILVASIMMLISISRRD